MRPRERHRRLESQDGEEQDHAGKVEDEEDYGIVEPARSKNLRTRIDAC
jgi:hypothetical protein